MTEARSSPSGPLIAELLAEAPVARVEGYTAASTLSLLLLAAGHTPGLYIIASTIIARVAATAGSLLRTITFPAPLFEGTGVVQGLANIAINTPGNSNTNFTSISLYSSGAGPIHFHFTGTGVTGSPVLDVTARAIYLGT